MLCQIWITYIKFKTFEQYLKGLESGKPDEKSDGQTDRMINRMHKHFLTFFESVKKDRIESK